MPILSLSLLRLWNFRCLGAATVLNSAGMMGETVVLGWLTLELTNSPFLVGVAMAVRAIPLFFVGVPAGVLADRFPRHRLLMVTGASQAVAATALGVLALLGLASAGARSCCSPSPPGRCAGSSTRRGRATRTTSPAPRS